jgi:hypothetical protein
MLQTQEIPLKSNSSEEITKGISKFSENDKSLLRKVDLNSSVDISLEVNLRILLDYFILLDRNLILIQS